MGDRSAEVAEPEMAVDEVGEEEDDEDSAVNPPPGAADECQEEETIEGLLEPFSREELLDLLSEACLRDPALLARIAASASSDAAHRRLFVHGLGPGATSAALAASLDPFGALDSATPSPTVPPAAAEATASSPMASHDGLMRFFREFGEIEEGPLGADHATGLFCGYAIFLYKSPEGLMKALEVPRKLFDGCELQCRRADRQTKKKRATAAPADAGGQRNVTGGHTAAFAFGKGD